MIPDLTSPATNPFPGLRPFREDEEYLFFGREDQVDAMVDKLAETRLLAVVGTSGSGKSSLVNCGLRPALRRGLMTRAGTAWRMAQFRPGGDPIGGMARALAQDGVLFRDFAAAGLSLAEIVETTLRMSKKGLIDIFEQAGLQDGVNLLVVVDQFEELFRYRRLDSAGARGLNEEAAAFVNLLLEVKTQTKLPIFIVLTMRSDFLGDCTQFPGLAEAVNAGQYLVPRLTRTERRAAIVGPDGVGGASMSPVLLTRLVNDVGDNPDQLSILQHALNRTWHSWKHAPDSDGPLQLSHYEAIGTMAHALDHHAEKAYAELSTPRQRQICEKLFKALTDKANDPRGVRRPTTLGALCALADATETEIAEVLAVFRKPSRSFLMPPAGEPLTADTVIDISHESLMRVWRRLDEWANEEARSAQTYHRLAETAALHAAGKASLWRDPDLQLALDWCEGSHPNETWAARYDPGFNAAMAFLFQSRDAREAEFAEQEAQRLRVLAAEHEKAEAHAREARRMRKWAIFSGALAVIAVIGVFWAFRSERKARDMAAEAERLADALKSERLVDAAEKAWSKKRPDLACLLAIEALNATQEVPEVGGVKANEHPKPSATFGARNALLKALQSPDWGPIEFDHVGELSSLAFTSDGSTFATGDEEGNVQLWKMEGRSALRKGEAVVHGSKGEKRPAHDGWVLSLAFAPDGKTLASAGTDGLLKVWKIDDVQGTPAPSQDVDSSPWEISELKPASSDVEAVSMADWITSVAFTSNGRTIASGSDDGTVALWTIGRNDKIETAYSWQAEKEAVRILAFANNGRTLASGSQGGKVKLWTIGEKAQSEHRTQLPDKVGEVLSFALAPDGKTLAYATRDSLRLLAIEGRDSAQSDAGVKLADSGSWVEILAFDRDGKTLASCGADGVVKIWKIEGQVKLRDEATLALDYTRVYSMAFAKIEKKKTLLLGGLGAPSDAGGRPKTVRHWNYRESNESRIGMSIVDYSDSKSEGLMPLSELVANFLNTRPTAFDQYATKLAVLQDDSVKLWRIEEPNPIPFYAGDALYWKAPKAACIAFAPEDEGMFAAGLEDGKVSLWTIPAKSVPVLLDGGTHRVSSVAFGPGGLLATVDEDDSARLWRINGSHPLPFDNGTPLGDPDGKLSCVAFAPSGNFLATGGEDKMVRFWRLEETTAELIVVKVADEPMSRHKHKSRVSCLAFARDGKTLVSGDNDGKLRLWTIEGLRATKVSEPFGHRVMVSCVAFTRDGKTLASASEKQIQLWEIDSSGAMEYGEPLSGHKSNVSSLAFDPQGNLFSVSGDGKVWRWKLDLGALKDMASTRVERNLTRREWKRYMGEDTPYQQTFKDHPEPADGGSQ